MWCSGKWSSTCYNSSSKRSSSHQCSVWKCVFRAIAKKVKCTLVQALRLCTGRTAHRGSRGIALLFHDHSTRRERVVSSTPRPHLTPRKDTVPILQEAGWAPGPVWTGAEYLVPTGIRSQTVQPVVNRYADWATRPTQWKVLMQKRDAAVCVLHTLTRRMFYGRCCCCPI